jgi:DNA-binding Xre family transcriptional regulator
MKDIFILQVENEMRKQRINKAKLSKLMGCSRATLDRVLDKNNNKVTLKTLAKLSDVLGYSLSIRLVDEKGIE